MLTKLGQPISSATSTNEIPGFSLTSVYDGTYAGRFVCEYQTFYVDENGETQLNPFVTESFNLTMTLKTITLNISGLDTVMLQITSVSCSEPLFGCGLKDVTPSTGSVVILPTEPLTTPMKPSPSGTGILIYFPNGTTLATENSVGATNVSSDGRTLSNSLAPQFQNNTWIGGNPPYDKEGFFKPKTSTIYFKSWILSKTSYWYNVRRITALGTLF